MAANEQDRRQARLAAALKENLRRRKLQAQQKAQGAENGQLDGNLGTAPPAGLEKKSHPKQKSASNAR